MVLNNNIVTLWMGCRSMGLLVSSGLVIFDILSPVGGRRTQKPPRPTQCTVEMEEPAIAWFQASWQQDQLFTADTQRPVTES